MELKSFFVVTLENRCGEYEFLETYVYASEKEIDSDDVLERVHALYDDAEIQSDGTIVVNGWDFAIVSVGINSVTKEEYEVLDKYLNSL